MSAGTTGIGAHRGFSYISIGHCILRYNSTSAELLSRKIGDGAGVAQSQTGGVVQGLSPPGRQLEESSGEQGVYLVAMLKAKRKFRLDRPFKPCSALGERCAPRGPIAAGRKLPTGCVV